MQPSLLRPMPIGDLLDTAFRLYRAHFTRFLTLTAVVLIPITMVRLLLLSSPNANQLLDNAQTTFLLPLISAALTSAGARIYANETFSLRQAYRAGARRYLSAFGAVFLQGLLIILPIVILGGCLLFAVSTNGASSPLIWVVFSLAIPLVVFVLTKYAVTLPAIMVEGIGAGAGMSRSWLLTKKRFWHVASVIVATTLLTLVLSELPALSVSYIAGTASAGSPALWPSALQIVLAQLGQMITLPLQYLVPVMLYYDLRIRNEGYDIEQASQRTPIVEQAAASSSH